MKQSKLASFLEALTGTAIGFIVSVLSQRFIFPMYGIHVAWSTDLKIVFWFTVISIVRSYIVRRWWNTNWFEKHAQYIYYRWYTWRLDRLSK